MSTWRALKDLLKKNHYHNHYYHYYLKKDALLLADVFEKFIGTFLKLYKLDPCHYFGSLRLSWKCYAKN